MREKGWKIVYIMKNVIDSTIIKKYIVAINYKICQIKSFKLLNDISPEIYTFTLNSVKLTRLLN